MLLRTISNWFRFRLTDWYPSSVKPVHLGWYKSVPVYLPMRRRSIVLEELSYWDGEQWLYADGQPCIQQRRCWYGRTTPPKD